MPFSPWTPERIERLKELWALGLSASQVAARMNAEAREQLFTRNSIVGKVSRLSIPMRNADMGKRRTSEFGFCPHAKVPGLSYCKTHAKRVFNIKEDGEIAKILETEDA
jgi:hypothetical protein